MYFDSPRAATDGYYAFRRDTNYIRREVGSVFLQVLEDAGVYKRTAEGRAAFLRFADAVNK